MPPTAIAMAIWNSTRLVASLNKLSPCTRAWILGGSDSRRPSALTATGSVLASTAPSTNARLAGIAASAPATAATAAAEASTRPTASIVTGRQTPPQVADGQFVGRRVQQRRQHHQADRIRRYPDRWDTGQGAHDDSGDHEQGGGRNPQPPGEDGDDRAQQHQQQDRLDTTHAADLATRPQIADQARPAGPDPGPGPGPDPDPMSLSEPSARLRE